MNDVMDKIAEALSRQTDLLELIAKGKDALYTKAPAGVHTATRLHGSGGLFADARLERDIITAHVRPTGITSVLPLLPSVYEDPRFGSITGFTADVGAEVTNACDDAPSGYIKGCNLTARFGMIRRDTNTIEFDKVMLRVSRGDHTDLVLRGRLLGLENVTPSGMNESQVLDLITMAEMVTAAVSVERKLGAQIWQGSRAILNEFPGLDAQIATGQMDA